MNIKLITNEVWEGIYHSDAPDYCDAYIVSADYDGIEMTDEQIDEFNDSDDKLELLMKHLY